MKRFTNQSHGSQAGRMYNGGAIIRRFALFPLMLLMLLLLPAGMVAQKAASSSKYIATYESSTQTLTFKKNVGETLPKNSAWVEDKMTVATIINNLGNGNIKHIVFDKSFSTYTPTTLYRFFGSLTTLETITDLEYLNTANVTDMHFMFYNCLKLTSLDVTHFNTTKVTNMSYMFFNCSSLTSLDVTHFNTAKVTDMGYMFYNCSSLTTIYASSKFVTPQVSKSFNMFYNCKKLKGEEVGWTRDKATDKTYAKIEGGYFSRIPRVKYADGTLTFFLTSKETLGENEYELNSGANPPGWKTHCKEITKVVFEASFANARPTSCYAWFQNFKNLTQIEGIENLNTQNVTSMRDMFNGCSSLTSLDLTNFNTAKVTDMKLLFAYCSALESLDLSMFNTENVTSMPSMFNGATNLKTLNVSNFNTEKVNNMGHMFANCPNLTSLDLSSFNTKGVEYVDNIFKNCSNLTTIYASENFAFGSGLKNGADMFLGCDKLKGFIEYNKNTDKNNSEFANYKTGYFTNLVGKNGDEKIGAVGEILTAENLTLNDDKDFVAYEPFAAKAASYSRKMNAGTTWATLCLPFEVSLENQNFRAFKLLSADDVTEAVELEEIEGSIEAGTPVIIKMKDGATKLNFTVANKEIAKDVQTAETANGNYQLQGLYTQKEFSKDTDNNCYIVKGSKLMNPAKLLGETATKSVGSKPFRAYMVDNSSAPAAGARMFSISVGGSTTAIEQLETTADSKAEYYDLQGRRLQNLQKGVNIVKRGGKTMKVIIK